jgi:hypothetical protein
MSFEQNIKSLSRTAAVDCTSAKNRFVAQNAAGLIAPVSVAGGQAMGVLRNNPLAGNIATVAYEGAPRVVIGAAALNAGVLVTSDATGAAIAAAAGNYILGETLVAGNPGEIVPVLLRNAGAKA